MQARPNRPTSVTVIAWVWIILGGLMVLAGIMAALMSAVMSSSGMMGDAFEDIEQEKTQDLPATVRVMEVVFRHFAWFALGQVCIGALALWAGTRFLRLRAWARAMLELLSWLFLIYVVAFTAFWMVGWTSVGAGHAPAAFIVAGLVGAVINMAFFGVPLGIMIHVLRGRKVRDAVRAGGAWALPTAPPAGPPMQSG
jgi:hypothetical protein